MINTEFKPYPWPPGRACTEPAPHMYYEVQTYRGLRGDFTKEFRSLLDNLSETRKKQLVALVASAMRDAGLGKLLPVTRNGYGYRQGEVDQLRRGRGKILEIRLEELFDPPKNIIPNKRLRLYFGEPLYPDVLVFFICEPKDATDKGLSQQNEHIDEAVKRADDWWRKNH